MSFLWLSIHVHLLAAQGIFVFNMYRIVGIFTGAKFHGNASRLFKRNFCSFYFCETNALHTDHTPKVDSALLILTLTTPVCFLWVHQHFVQQQAYSSLQQPFKGQKDWTICSHEYQFVSMYANNNVINFNLTAYFIFLQFLIFTEAGLSTKIPKICTQ